MFSAVCSHSFVVMIRFIMFSVEVFIVCSVVCFHFVFGYPFSLRFRMSLPVLTLFLDVSVRYVFGWLFKFCFWLTVFILFLAD